MEKLVPSDIRWAINDVEMYVFGAETITWPLKVLDNCVHILHVLHNLHNASLPTA